MVHLEHLFARGIRFDTEVQYLAQVRDGLHYENLPVRKSVSVRACALTSAMQCVAVLGQVPRAVAMRKLRRALQAGNADAADTIDTIDDRKLLQCITAFDADVAAELLSSDSASEIGRAAWVALRTGHMGMLWFETPRGHRWATLIGVERDRATQQARALLLLDASASEPWACAHNVRIELHTGARAFVHANPGFVLRCRHLTGEASAVRLLGLMVLKGAPAMSGWPSPGLL